MSAKILLVDDHPALRRGLSDAIARNTALTLVGEASTGASALRLAQDLVPDVIIMDIHLPDMNGIDVTEQILHAMPSLKIIIFSSEVSRPYIDKALQTGVCGYLSKRSALDELLQGIDLVLEGRLYLSSDVSAGILEDYQKSLLGESEPQRAGLTERERELLRLVAQGQRNKEIADSLGISVKSVEANRSRLMQKLGCSNSAELVRYAIREGIAEL